MESRHTANITVEENMNGFEYMHNDTPESKRNCEDLMYYQTFHTMKRACINKIFVSRALSCHFLSLFMCLRCLIYLCVNNYTRINCYNLMFIVGVNTASLPYLRYLHFRIFAKNTLLPPPHRICPNMRTYKIMLYII